MDRNGCIGKNNTLPWKLSSDLRRFKMLTVGKTCIMGRKTFESIGKPLPNRCSVVLSRVGSFVKTEVTDSYSVINTNNFDQTIDTLIEESERESMIIGGYSVYRDFLPVASRLYITHVDLEVKEGDTFFPEWNKNEWKEVYSEKVKTVPISIHEYEPSNTFKIYDRVSI